MSLQPEIKATVLSLLPEDGDVHVLLSLGYCEPCWCTLPADEIVCRDIRVFDTVLLRRTSGVALEITRVVLEDRPLCSEPWRKGVTA